MDVFGFYVKSSFITIVSVSLLPKAAGVRFALRPI